MTDTTHEHRVGDLVITEVKPDEWEVRTSAGYSVVTLPLREVADRLAERLTRDGDSFDDNITDEAALDLVAKTFDACGEVFNEIADQVDAHHSQVELLEDKFNLLNAWGVSHLGSRWPGPNNRAARRGRAAAARKRKKRRK